MRFTKIILGVWLPLILVGCVETPEDAMDQYRYWGLEGYIDDMVAYSETSPIYTQVFNDSIFPKIMNELSFDELAKISDKVKNHSTYKNFQEVDIPADRIEKSFNNKNPLDACKFYQKYQITFKGLNEIYRSKILVRDKDNASFSEIIEMNNILSSTPLKNKLTQFQYSDELILDYFKLWTPEEGAKKLIAYHNMFPAMDTVYRQKILPVIVNAPYEVLLEITNTLKGSDYYQIIYESSKQARDEYLFDIKRELNNHKDIAVEALDRVIIPSIQLELDSLSLSNAKTVTNKFIGGFLNIRKLALSFGRDESKLKDLWNEHVKSEKYDEIFDKHIKGLLDDVYTSQNEYYKKFIGADRKKVIYQFMSEPLLIQYPKQSELIQKYIKSNKFGYVKSIAEWLPYVGDVIMISDTYDMLTNDSEEEKLEDKDAFILFCQQMIIGQVREDYFENVRDEVIKVIDYSYDQLFKDISKKI